jgi:hypothetical protein
MFKDIADVRERLGKQQYIASEEIRHRCLSGPSLSKPILAEGTGRRRQNRTGQSVG